MPIDKEYYLENYDKCPYCQSQNINCEDGVVMHNQVWMLTECRDCEKEWKEIYQLADVEEFD